MVATQFDEQNHTGRIVLRSNNSWTWRANLALVVSLMIVSGAIAIGFTLHGLWMVLPFSALEMTVLLACLHYCVRRTHAQEVLTFSPDELVLEQGHYAPEHTYRFHRFFARFFVEPPNHRWYSSRVAIHHRGDRIEIGGFLTADDKLDLVREIRAMIRRFDGA